MEAEKIFNLQLTVQKLEEELSLYRNGTTSGELFELISEKDSEIAELQRNLSDKDTTLRKIAKSSADVLQRCDSLQEKCEQQSKEAIELQKQMQEKDRLLLEQEKMIDDLSSEMLATAQRAENAEAAIAEFEGKQRELEQQLWDAQQETHEENMRVLAKDSEISSLKEKMSQLQELTEQKDQMIAKLQGDVKSCEASIDKLQTRCAALVAEKSEKLRQLDQERQEMLQHVQKFRDSMNANLTQRDEALRRKEERIKELGVQLSIAQQDAKLKATSTGSSERDALFQQKVQVANLQSKLDEAERKLKLVDEEKKALEQKEKLHEMTKQRVADLVVQLQLGQLQLPVGCDVDTKLQSTKSTDSLSSAGSNSLKVTTSRRRSLSDRTNRLPETACADSCDSNGAGSKSVPKSYGSMEQQRLDELHFDASDFSTTRARHTHRKFDRGSATSASIELPVPQKNHIETSRLR